MAAPFICIKCRSVVPTAGANSHTEESDFCVSFQFARSRELGGYTRKAGSPISKTLRYVCISSKASALIGYKFHNFSIHECSNRCLLLHLSSLTLIRQLPLLRGCLLLLYSAKPFLNFCAASPSQRHGKLSACSTAVNNFLFFLPSLL